ncbi:MAG: hypothetical protein CL820_04700 [Croceicoccus sp.]|nr:hypothetical protein [Croceicoccus sp.]MAL25187.1 hypothetical protein [Croceicoccus sp.]|tara:strand:- start:86534 stop:86845 length:312 start_codon:yes stop_codon:yes gene_type:complete
MKLMRITLALVGAALLASCSSEPERSANDTRDAGGEVLEGTITDEMIQLDQLRSQGDPAEVEAEDAAGGDAGTSAGTDAAEPAGGDGEAAPPAEAEPEEAAAE